MARLRRALVALAVAAAPLATLVAPGLTETAAATSAGVGFTADALTTYQTNGIAWSVAEAEGIVYVGGTFSAVRPSGSAAGVNESAASNFVALDAATGVPRGCQLSFTGTSSSVRALGVSPDKQTLYAAGLFSAVNGIGVQNVAAIDLTTCTPISTFRPAVSGWVRALSVAPSGDIYLAGEFGTVAGQTRQRFAALSASGALLPWAPVVAQSPAPAPPATPGAGYAVAVTADGRNVAIGGAFTSVNGADSHALAIVDTSAGATVRGYPNNFVPANSTVKSIFADTSGIYTGNEGTGFQVFDGRIALDPLTFNQRWRDTCLGATQDVLADNGALYGASHAHDCTTMGGFPNGRRQHLTVEGTDDPHLKVWWPDTNDGLGEGIGPRALAISASGDRRYLFAVGEFTSVNGVAQQGVLRLADGPDTGAPPAPTGLSASTAVAGRVQLRWLASTDRDDEALTYKVYRGSTLVATIDGRSDWWRRPQLSYVDTTGTPGTLYVYKVTASDSSGNTSAGPTLGVRPSATSSSYATTVLADQPSLYWRYNETAGGTLADDSDGGNAGILVGTRTAAATPAALAADSSTAMTFDGSTGYAYQSQPTTPSTAFTVETWFQTTTTTGGKLIGFGGNVTTLSADYDRHIYMRNDGKLSFGVYNGAFNTITSPAAYNDGQWHHAVASQGAGGMALYVDGVSVASNLVKTAKAFQGYWRVGGDNLTSWPVKPSSNFFAGKLDETAVYPTALSSAAVAAHFRAGKGTISGDTQPPSTPTGLTTKVTGSDVALSWTASTDNTGVAGYQVHRSSTAGFTPSASTQIATPTGTTYTDAARPAGTWYYRVVAVDAAGNPSPASTEASATVASAASSVTQTVAPSADTYVNSASSATNSGTSTSLASGGTGVVSYVRFPLPAAPAGTVLKSATLRTMTTTLASAGSVDGHPVALGPAGWTETGLTWANRPAAPSPATTVGTITGASGPSTVSTTTLDVTALAPFAGKDLNLTIRDSGTDTMWFWSRQAASATQRPQITLVYGAP